MILLVFFCLKISFLQKTSNLTGVTYQLHNKGFIPFESCLGKKISYSVYKLENNELVQYNCYPGCIMCKKKRSIPLKMGGVTYDFFEDSFYLSDNSYLTLLSLNSADKILGGEQIKIQFVNDSCCQTRNLNCLSKVTYYSTPSPYEHEKNCYNNSLGMPPWWKSYKYHCTNRTLICDGYNEFNCSGLKESHINQNCGGNHVTYLCNEIDFPSSLQGINYDTGVMIYRSNLYPQNESYYGLKDYCKKINLTKNTYIEYICDVDCESNCYIDNDIQQYTVNNDEVYGRSGKYFYVMDFVPRNLENGDIGIVYFYKKDKSKISFIEYKLQSYELLTKDYCFSGWVYVCENNRLTVVQYKHMNCTFFVEKFLYPKDGRDTDKKEYFCGPYDFTNGGKKKKKFGLVYLVISILVGVFLCVLFYYVIMSVVLFVCLVSFKRKSKNLDQEMEEFKEESNEYQD